LPGVFVDGDPEAAQSLLELERRGADHPTHRSLAAVAAQLHLIAEVLPDDSSPETPGDGPRE
jgi:hypothetical protein